MKQLMIEDLMEEIIRRGGSDIHISAGLPPYFRINGELQPTEYDPLTPEEVQRLIFSMLNNTQRKQLEQNWELDCSYGVRGIGRFRVNVYRERGAYACAMRALASEIPSIEKLGLPDICKEVARLPRGLVLVTGTNGIRQIHHFGRYHRLHQPRAS
jgi:twitching motility protein PilT